MRSSRPVDAAPGAAGSSDAETTGIAAPLPRAALDPALRPGPAARPPAPVPSPSEAGADPSADDARQPAEPADGQPAGAPPADEPASAWALVTRAQQNDGEAFGLLYDRYVGMVFRYLYHRLGDRPTAEDFTSETFVRALRRIDSVTYQGSDVGAWLVTIARNIVLDHVKSSRYRLEVSTADMRDADRATAGPEDAVLQGLTNAQLLACVAQLNPEQQECIALRFLQGMSVAETAAVMGKNEGAIKALQHRAVRRLATLLPAGLR